jgi:hypothetical protein
MERNCGALAPGPGRIAVSGGPKTPRNSLAPLPALSL